MVIEAVKARPLMLDVGVVVDERLVEHLVDRQLAPLGQAMVAGHDRDPWLRAKHPHGHLGIRRLDPDFYALLMADLVLGSGPGFTDRLSQRLRDQMGLAYTVFARIARSADLEPGTILAAYRGGLFPMPVRRKLGWWSPDPRGVIPLDGLKVSRSRRMTSSTVQRPPIADSAATSMSWPAVALRGT